jgi:hypothetical protein
LNTEALLQGKPFNAKNMQFFSPSLFVLDVFQELLPLAGIAIGTTAIFMR